MWFRPPNIIPFAFVAAMLAIILWRPQHKAPPPAPPPPRPTLWTDPLTGCDYLINGPTGISARFAHNGLPVCHDVP